MSKYLVSELSTTSFLIFGRDTNRSGLVVSEEGSNIEGLIGCLGRILAVDLGVNL